MGCSSTKVVPIPEDNLLSTGYIRQTKISLNVDARKYKVSGRWSEAKFINASPLYDSIREGDFEVVKVEIPF